MKTPSIFLYVALAEGFGRGCNCSSQVIRELQDPITGTFFGDEWGETDTRFLYGALNALSLLGRLDAVDLDAAVRHVRACENVDGGYGVSPGAESHAGQTFTCLGALAIARRLHLVDRDRIGRWLSERQVEGGGLNGRPEKREDVCYGWWVLASLAMVDRLHWIDGERLQSFILECQVSLLVLVLVLVLKFRPPVYRCREMLRTSTRMPTPGASRTGPATW